MVNSPCSPPADPQRDPAVIVFVVFTVIKFATDFWFALKKERREAAAVAAAEDLNKGWEDLRKREEDLAKRERDFAAQQATAARNEGPPRDGDQGDEIL